MNWYLVKLVFRIICGDGEHTPQFDEQLRLVFAGDRPEAFSKAKNMGIAGEEVFLDAKRQLVQWKFINVSELHTLNGLTDGAELYSHINETEDAGNYIAFTHSKAADLESGFTHNILNLL